MLSLVRALATSFVAVGRHARLLPSSPRSPPADSRSEITPSTSTWEYQTSRFDMVGHRAHRLPVGLPQRTMASARTPLGWPLVAARHHDAGRQALHVPLPGSRVGLVEVVAIEDELALGRPEDAEVREVGVAAELGGESRAGVVERSEAMMSAAPRKKVNGETSMRP